MNRVLAMVWCQDTGDFVHTHELFLLCNIVLHINLAQLFICF